MVSINTNPEDIEFVLTRGVENIYPTKEALRTALLSGKRLRIYAGFDPSTKSLHIGNAIVLLKLGQLQKLGHQIIFLIGSFTGMIGDPTDKTAARIQLTRNEVIKNSHLFKLQASHYLNFAGTNPALVRFNHTWLDKINFKDLIGLTSHFTVQQMIERDMFQKRLAEKKPIYLHEFLYPLAQAYDSVALDVDMEIGGNDQTFNMLCGRNLVKELNHKEKFVLTLKLLADSSGKKMGKTEGNIISLDSSPDDMYGQVMAWPDAILLNALELCTNISNNELAQIRKQLQSGLNPKEAKNRLAFLITELNYDARKAKAAQDRFEKVFSQKDLKGEMAPLELKPNLNLLDIVLTAKPELSKSAAKRLIEQKQYQSIK